MQDRKRSVMSITLSNIILQVLIVSTLRGHIKRSITRSASLITKGSDFFSLRQVIFKGIPHSSRHDLHLVLRVYLARTQYLERLNTLAQCTAKVRSTGGTFDSLVSSVLYLLRGAVVLHNFVIVNLQG